MGVKDGGWEETPAGKLKIWGTTEYAAQKDVLWDKLKEIGGANVMNEVEADIKFECKDCYTKHTVSSGESLSKISKRYYRDPMKYMAIFEANTGLLKNPNVIHPGQELVIPFDS